MGLYVSGGRRRHATRCTPCFARKRMPHRLMRWLTTFVVMSACGGDKLIGVECLTGEHLDAEGACVADITCGPGTVRAGRQCLPSSDAGQPLPDDGGVPLSCGPGTGRQ